MDVTLNKVNIIPLTDKNYPTWKLQMKMSLMKDGLFSIVNGTETIAPNAANNEVLKFNQRKDKALATIVLAIDPSLLYLVGDPDDPEEVWLLLQNTFMKKTWSNKLALKRKLYSAKMNNNDSLKVHLKTLTEIFDSLAVVGSPLEEEDKVITTLASLPDKFSTVVTALETLDKVPSLQSVTEKLLHEEVKLSQNTSSVTANENQSLAVKHKKNIKCHECGKLGHIKRNCYVHLRKVKNCQDKANNAVKKDSTGQPEEVVTLIASAFAASGAKQNSWIIDSGCTNHMCNKKDIFFNYNELSNPVSVQVGDGKTVRGIGKGNVWLDLKLPYSGPKKCILQDVYYVPDLAYNLVSVSQLAEKGKDTIFRAKYCTIKDKKNKLLGVGTLHDKLYILDCEFKRECSYITQTKSKQSEEELWHSRFCHLGIDNIRKMNSKKMFLGMDYSINENHFFCKNCVDGKIHRTPFPKISSKEVRKPLDLIHSDVCGKMNPVSLGGGLYFVTFIDDASRYTWVYIIKNKSDVFKTFVEWKTLVEKQYEKKIKILRSDIGGEYTSNEFEMFLKKEGILHQKTVPKTPEQNGVAERYNRTIVEAVRSMLSASGLSKQFWAEALSTAVYTRNRSISIVLGDKTPYEVLNGRKPNVKHLRTFGCQSYSHVSSDERSKLDSKAKSCIFLGYSNITKGYRMFDSKTKKIFHSRDVVFSETEFPNSQIEKENEITPYVEIQFDDLENTDDESLDEPSLRRSQRERKAPDRLGEWTCFSKDISSNNLSVEKALNGPESNKWHEAMQKEMLTLHRNNVWTLVKPPKDKKIVQCRWVLKKKINSDGSVGTYKARLVAKGFQQQEGIDYDETFSPVVRFESVRTVLSLAASLDLNVHHMDVTGAFLNGNLDNEIYMYQPDYFNDKNKDLVCKLTKSIYGLKQSPKCWNDNLDKFLKDQGFVQSISDSCIYTKFINGNIFIVAVYVDDLILACKSIDDIYELKKSLSDSYEMKDLGKLEYFLGVNVSQKNQGIFIHQSAYVKSLLNKYGFKDANSVSTPFEPGLILKKATDECELFDSEIYQSAVGSLLYLSTRTRPDIAYAVSSVSKYCLKPTTNHWSAIKRIFRYLKGTIDLGIFYKKQNIDCVGYADADWAGDKSDYKSTSGYCFKVGSAIVSWKSSKQTIVALSTAEAEYIALSAAAQEAVWFKDLLDNFKIYCNDPMIINEDNQSAISIAKNTGNHGKTKHINIKYHYVRDLIQNNIVELKYCPSKEMLADLFTKPLSKQRFLDLCSMIGMNCLSKIN